MKTLIIDGLSGSGKWVISRLCCAINGVENLSVDECFELTVNANYVTPSKDFNEILELYLRVYNYNKFIGREVNMRKNDFTFSSKYPFKKIDAISEREEGIYSVLKDAGHFNIIETHGGSVCGLSDYLQNFKESIILCKVKRSPVEVLLRWSAYVNRYGNDLAELTYCFNYKEISLPWFVKDYEKEYIDAKTNLEKVTIIFIASSARNTAAVKKIKNATNFIEVEFDDFVADPLPKLNKIVSMLGADKLKEDIYEKLCEELEVPRKSKWEEKNYWKLKSDSDFELEFNAMRPTYQEMLNNFLNGYSLGNIYI